MYFHGTIQEFSPGDVLRGDVGELTDVYLTHGVFSLSEVREEFPSHISSSVEFAQWSALMWAAMKADADCTCGEKNHVMRYYDNRDTTCLYLYEVEPQGVITFDDSHDCGPEGVKVASGVIKRLLT